MYLKLELVRHFAMCLQEEEWVMALVMLWGGSGSGNLLSLEGEMELLKA